MSTAFQSLSFFRNTSNLIPTVSGFFLTVVFPIHAIAMPEAHPFIDLDGGMQLEYTSPVVGAAVGLQFTPEWSADIGYQSLGEGDGGVNDSISATTELFSLGIRYDWGLTEQFSIYNRLGAAYYNVEKKEFKHHVDDVSGIAPMGEIGVKYQFNAHLSFDAGYQLLLGIGDDHTKKYDSNALTFGLRYQFNPFEAKELPTVIETQVIESAADEVVTKPIVVKEIVTVIERLNDSMFAFNSSVLVDKESLKSALLLLREDEQSTVIIAGYADSDGRAEYNQLLSEKRAMAVANYFESHGINHQRIESVGYGESRPIASNATAEGRAKNRRVELEVTLKKNKATVVTQELPTQVVDKK